MEYAVSAVAKLDANEAEMEHSFQEESTKLEAEWQNPEENIKLRAEFWESSERDDLMSWDKSMAQVFDWLLEHKYELENHFTVFDWLKIYADSIKNYELDMNLAL
jgi:hypothetical protein